MDTFGTDIENLVFSLGEYFNTHISESSFLRLVVLFVIMIFGRSIIRILTHRVIVLAMRSSSYRAEKLQRKTKTVVSLLVNTITVLLWIIVGMILLDMGGIDIRPILAGASILGFAIGFGSQSLVKDLVTGAFIIIEDQFSVGDEVKIGAFEGVVVRLSARSTVIREKTGALIFLENGSITTVINYSRVKKSASVVTTETREKNKKKKPSLSSSTDIPTT